MIYEVHRHQYLSAMGIDSYMPRLLLPNSPEVFECEWPPQMLEQAAQITEPVLEPQIEYGEANTQQPEPTPVAAPISAKADKAANDLLAELGSEKPQPTKAKPANLESAVNQAVEATQTQKPVSFTLSIWRLDKVLVVDSRDSSKALPTEKLLLSILRAIQMPLGNLPKAQVLRWPMLEGGIADESAEAARDMLSAFFDTGTVEHDTWLLMGDAAQIALPESAQPTAPGQLLSASDLDTRFHSGDDIQVAILPSLVQMLEQPSLKADAWQALKQL